MVGGIKFRLYCIQLDLDVRELLLLVCDLLVLVGELLGLFSQFLLGDHHIGFKVNDLCFLGDDLLVLGCDVSSQVDDLLVGVSQLLRLQC